MALFPRRKWVIKYPLLVLESTPLGIPACMFIEVSPDSQLVTPRATAIEIVWQGNK